VNAFKNAVNSIITVSIKIVVSVEVGVIVYKGFDVFGIGPGSLCNNHDLGTCCLASLDQFDGSVFALRVDFGVNLIKLVSLSIVSRNAGFDAVPGLSAARARCSSRSSGLAVEWTALLVVTFMGTTVRRRALFGACGCLTTTAIVFVVISATRWLGRA
jgi:hypothetical protein